MFGASLKQRQIATKERKRAGRVSRPRRGSDRALKPMAIGVLISLALTGGAQSASSPGSNVTRSCMDKSYELSNGCKGSSVLIQGCFADMIELSECTKQLGKTVEDTISKDFCYKAYDKHCSALQTKVEFDKGGCSAWCKAAVSKYQPRGCSGESAICNQQDVDVFRVTNPYYLDLVCPAIADPAWYTSAESKFCCHYLKDLLIENCKPIPCERLLSYIDAMEASGGCSAAVDCMHLGFQADLSHVGQLFDSLKAKFRLCIQPPKDDGLVVAPTTPTKATNCTAQRAEIETGFCKGYPLGWSACTDGSMCGRQVALEAGNALTPEFCTSVLQSLCAAVGGRPRCKSSCSFICEMLVSNVWPPQCDSRSDCEKPSMTSSAYDPVPPLCCGSLRRTILANCDRVDVSLLDAYMASVVEKGIPSTAVSTDAMTAVRKEESCNASDCVDVPVCSIVQFPEAHMKNDVFCYMLNNKHFLNQELTEDPVGWDKRMALSYKKVPVEVYKKSDAGCEDAYKQWMCAYHARPCARTQEPTHLCLGFCINFMKCNSSIQMLMSSMQATESTIQNLDEDELSEVAANRICISMSMSSNYNSQDTCFNGVELQGQMMAAAHSQPYSLSTQLLLLLLLLVALPLNSA